MNTKRDILKGACERLFRHHKESEEVCRGLEDIEKSSGPHYRPKHAHNRDFYERMTQGSETERIHHFPKIIKDAFMLKRNKMLLKERKHALKVYKVLKDIGANFGWGIDGY